ncbi:MAG: hypothetical protein QMC85_02460 [Methanocellales archaeon]|nr:hypothetical protein [Methanocellales archaeon]MDI6902926.1 hypothetical protein [Methanocellales archaeon]
MIDMHPITMLGIILISIGIILVALPFLVKYAPSLGEIHPFIIYIYHRNNFYFITSPILLLTFIISVMFFLLAKYIL